MFSEEACETFVLNRFQSARTPGDALYDTSLASVQVVQVGEVTIDNINEWVKTAPCIVFNLGDDNRAMQTIGARNDANNMTFAVNVYLFSTNKYQRKAQANEARPILRSIRNLLRGLLWTPADGATDGVARFFYLSQEKLGEDGPLSLYLQQYEIHSQDINDTRRSL